MDFVIVRGYLWEVADVVAVMIEVLVDTEHLGRPVIIHDVIACIQK